MLYREIIAVCSEIHTKHINTAVWAERRIVNVRPVCDPLQVKGPSRNIIQLNPVPRLTVCLISISIRYSNCRFSCWKFAKCFHPLTLQEKKGRTSPWNRPRGTQRGSRGIWYDIFVNCNSSTLSLTSAIDGAGSQLHVLAASPPGMTRYPLYRRLGGPRGRSGRVQKISPPTEFWSPNRPSCNQLQFWPTRNDLRLMLTVLSELTTVYVTDNMHVFDLQEG